MKIIDIAKVCHETNRAYCETHEDFSQQPWEMAPSWQLASAVAGVQFHIDNPNATPEDSHNEWLKFKQADGWVYGPLKDPETKQHPCIMDYQDLSVDQRIKDSLFLCICRTLIPLLD